MNNLAETVMKKIISSGMTVSTAESCTGGKAAAALISYAGASSAFKEGFVTYTNESKNKRLGVKKETLEKYGAVSEETAAEMSKGVSNTANTDIGLSTTGIAGPGGGTDEKPVGLVYISVHIKGKTTVKKLNLKGKREEIRNSAVIELLSLLNSLL